MTKLEKQIDEKIGEVRTDALDLSYGEIANLHSNEELIIQPDYQRLFRWTYEQRSRFIESILIELPIPQIFVIENDDGVYELIDGLQRVSSVLQFLDPKSVNEGELVLEGCGIIADLNGKKLSDLPLSLRLRIKRSSLRTIVIKKQSKSFLRYEMFKRLNTGGALLSPQEIRNCSARMVGAEGIQFYAFLQEMAANQHFKATTVTLAQPDLDQKGDEELVLRFYATKNAADMFKGSVRDWLTDYMEEVILGKRSFEYEQERSEFRDTFELINQKLGDTAFVKFRGNSPLGGLAPAYYEGIAVGCSKVKGVLNSKPQEKVKGAIVSLVQSNEFRDVTGPGANNRTKLLRRISLVEESIRAA